MKKVDFCTACEWQGDGAGMAACPICGQPITTLDVGEEANSANEEYPEDILAKEEQNEEIDDKDI